MLWNIYLFNILSSEATQFKLVNYLFSQFLNHSGWGKDRRIDSDTLVGNAAEDGPCARFMAGASAEEEVVRLLVLKNSTGFEQSGKNRSVVPLCLPFGQMLSSICKNSTLNARDTGFWVHSITLRTGRPFAYSTLTVRLSKCIHINTEHNDIHIH